MRHKNTKQKRRSVYPVIIYLAAAALAAGILIGANLHQTKAEDSAPLYKYYTSYEIREGDSLWSIAEEYRDAAAQSVRGYIDEVCAINHLSSEEIRAGETICIPYYSNINQ